MFVCTYLCVHACVYMHALLQQGAHFFRPLCPLGAYYLSVVTLQERVRELYLELIIMKILCINAVLILFEVSYDTLPASDIDLPNIFTFKDRLQRVNRVYGNMLA